MGGVTVEDIHQCIAKCQIMLRPRGTLARTLYNKYLSDEHLDNLDKQEVEEDGHETAADGGRSEAVATPLSGASTPHSSSVLSRNTSRSHSSTRKRKAATNDDGTTDVMKLVGKKLESLQAEDAFQWYTIDKSRLSPQISNIHIQLVPDDETEEFLENSRNLSNNVLLQIFHALVKFFLSFFMTQTSINGWLGRGSMFVLSKTQFAQLSCRREGQEGDLADLGAGDGSTTAVMANFFSRVTVTEVSKAMRPQLMKKGFRVAEVDSWYERQYDMISCLNVLDRCEKPLTILRQVKTALKPNAKAIVALVLPFKPYVETGTKDNKPTEELGVTGQTFEDQVTSMIEVLEGEGFRVDAWSRVPYLCQGDLNQAYYWLHDAIFVLSLPIPTQSVAM